jgi:hypothetical protein
MAREFQRLYLDELAVRAARAAPACAISNG